MNPDFEIEQYWLELKVFMSNFYSETNIKSRNIIHWSNTLNKLQEEKNYIEIEYSIRSFLTCFLIDVMRYNKIYNGIIYSHYSGITNGYIGKWNRLSERFGFNSSDTSFGSTFYNIVFCIFEIYYKIMESKLNSNRERLAQGTLESNSKHFTGEMIGNSLAIELVDYFNDIEIYLINKDFRWLIKFAIDNKQSSILERLKECIDIIPIIENIYSITIPKILYNANFRKIIDLIYK
jgi:hypothetical protein